MGKTGNKLAEVYRSQITTVSNRNKRTGAAQHAVGNEKLLNKKLTVIKLISYSKYMKNRIQISPTPLTKHREMTSP